MSTSHRRDMMRRGFGLLTALTLVIGGLTAAFALTPDLAADAVELPSPPPLLQRDDNVVTADPIPTVQIDNGYVWAQATIGSTVYAVGDFDNARAPLAAPGTQLTARSNVLAYDINTGDLLPFAPQVNGVIKAVAASPDGSRIYIGGSFSSVNGQVRYSIAALDATTGQLITSFKPSVGGSGVYALVAKGATVYAGGLFTQANGTPRTNAAAFSAGNGALMPWAPQSDRQIDAMVADPGGQKIIVAGRFASVNGNTAMRGAAAVNELTGAVDANWALTQTVKNGSSSGGDAGKAGIFALAADDSGVYGTGWVFAGVTTGNLEGTFAAEAETGTVRWIADCLGDHYGVYSTGETVYTTSHTHACSTMGLHPEQSTRQYRYAEAYTADARGLLGRNPHAGGTYQNWEGTPGPSAYAWYPDFLVGTTSGLGQAGLSITGVGDTISIAGEFVSVNNAQFEGIVRFAKSPPAGAKNGPRLSGSAWQPVGNSVVSGRARVSFAANWDRDDMDLTYELRRSGTSAPVATLEASSTWWNQPSMTLEDTTATPGTQYTYTVVARDGDGNAATSAPVTVTAAAGVASDYVSAVLDDSPQLYYPLGDTRQDWAGSNPPVFGGGVDAEQPGIDNSSTGYSTFDGTTSGRVVSSARATVSTAFSTELWVRTTSTRGGKLMGYGDAASGSSSSYDRHVYMRDDGRIVFGVYPGSAQTVQSPASYNDGQWHHVVASQGADGITLYVDGAVVDANSSVTSAQAYQGYWRIGGDNLNGWPNAPSSNYFNGDLDEVAVYGYALDANQVNTHFGIGNGLEAPSAAFDATASELGVSVDAGASTAASGATIVQYTWDFGDKTSVGSGEMATHDYAAAGSYDVSLTVLDSNGLSSTTTQRIDVTGPNSAPIAVASTTANGLTVTADGSGSSDPDGEIAGYAWDWGDGETSAGQIVSHAYAEAGDYTVTLTVTDDQDGTAEVTKLVSVVHADPTAQFDASSSARTVDVDAGGSVAVDGATLSYEWDWGDGTATSAGQNASHVYTEDGSYEITLTVTDSLGSTHSTTQSVSVTEQVFVGSDAFERTVSNGWGAADVGGAWTSSGWNSGTVSVDDGAGRLALSPGAGRDLVLGGTSLSESGSAMTYSVGSGPSTGSLYVGLKSRYGDGSAYRSAVWHRADGTMWLLVQRDDAVLASLPLSGQQWAAGDVFHLRTEVVGDSSPTIRVKVWADGLAEPSGWQLETKDTSASALAGPGSSAVYLYRSGSATGQNVISVDDYRLQDGSGQAPAARKAALAPPAELAPEREPVIEKDVLPDAEQPPTTDDGPEKDSEPAPDRDSDAGPEPGPADDPTAEAGAEADAAQDADPVADPAADTEPAEGPAKEAENASEAESGPTDESSSEDGDQAGESEEVQDAGDSPEADEAAGSTDAEGAAEDDQDSEEKAAAEESTDVAEEDDAEDVAASDDDTEDPAASGGADAGDAAPANDTEDTADATDTTDEEEASAPADAAPTEDSTMPSGTPVVQDDFDRSSDTGWGDAERGGTWTLAEALEPATRTADGEGALDLPAGESVDALLDGTSLSQSTVDLTFHVDAAADAVDGQVGVVARTTEDSQYSVRAAFLPDGTVELIVVSGEEIVATQMLDGMAFSPDASYTLRVSVTGSSPTTISAKLWEIGTDEPEDWQLTTTDGTSSLQGEGAVGLVAEEMGGAEQLNVRFEEFVVVSGD
ncbi:MAG: PKD domain-containing protein [Brachybacterium tyrofermentans]|uniref:PKD domain-containing protein n=1 Tax=Brachybacterium tyrofermentans TaxID=47848 RepID=UPI003F904F0A